MLLKLFRITAFLEGISFILLLFVGVPMKYLGENQLIVKILGLPHGILFMAYLVLMFVFGNENKWNTVKYITGFLGSVIPFGTFYVDAKLLKPLAKKQVGSV